MIYVDNAATTWPKPEQTIAAMAECVRLNGANPGRGGHKMSLSAGRIIFHVREAVANLFNVKDPSRIVFTGNATESLNLAVKGLLRSGDHVITSSMEHNAVARPIHVLKSQGVEVTEVMSTATGELDPGEIKRAIRPNTKAVVVLHASNVTGSIMPINEIGEITRERDICFIVDASQTAGFLDIDVNTMNVDLLAFTGHKGLFGPQGTGGLYIREGVNLRPLKEGGTGSKSEMPEQPEDMPDKFESGTLNTPGLAGLGAGIKFINSRGLERIRKHEYELLTRFLNGLTQIPGIIIYGPQDPEKQVPVVSFNIKDQDSSEVAFILDKAFDIACRSGLHCAPAAHRTIGTIHQGTVRASFSVFNTEDDVDHILDAIEKTAAELSR